MIVCHCRAVSDREIRRVVASGARALDEVTDICGAGGDCGGCAARIHALVEAAPPGPPPPADRPVRIGALAAV